MACFSSSNPSMLKLRQIYKNLQKIENIRDFPALLFGAASRTHGRLPMSEKTFASAVRSQRKILTRRIIPLLFMFEFYSFSFTRACVSSIPSSEFLITSLFFFLALLPPVMSASSYLGNKLVQMGTKIVGIGRNYAAHAKEMGAAIPKEPLIFLKPTSSYVREGSSVEIPSSCTFLDHEVELGVVIGKKGRDIPESLAMDHVSGYALALDMTARELQAVAKKQGLPWTLAKGYDTFTPIGNFIPKKQVPNLSDLELWLEVDGKLRQKGSTSDMIFSVPVLISYISTIMTLNEGDIILTGTPSGVGPVKAGQHMKAGITGLAEMSFEVKARKSARV